jgi:hypothetical protein
MATVDKFVNQISDDMSANEGVNKVKAFDHATILVIIPHQNIYTENKDALVNSSLKVMGRSDEKEIAQLQEEVK